MVVVFTFRSTGPFSGAALSRRDRDGHRKNAPSRSWFGCSQDPKRTHLTCTRSRKNSTIELLIWCHNASKGGAPYRQCNDSAHSFHTCTSNSCDNLEHLESLHTSDNSRHCSHGNNQRGHEDSINMGMRTVSASHPLPVRLPQSSW